MRAARFAEPTPYTLEELYEEMISEGKEDLIQRMTLIKATLEKVRDKQSHIPLVEVGDDCLNGRRDLNKPFAWVRVKEVR